jgi:hypothetical protein
MSTWFRLADRMPPGYPIVFMSRNTLLPEVKNMKKVKVAVVLCAMLACHPLSARGKNGHNIPDQACDIASFGFRVSDTDGRWHGIRWAEPGKLNERQEIIARY